MISLVFLDPAKVTYRHAVAVDECALDLKVDLGAIVADGPNGVDRLRIAGDHLVADLRNPLLRHADSVTGACVKCGQSALGRASDGLEYCHRVTCCDWKAERWKAIEMRRSA